MKAENCEVLYADAPILKIGRREIESLKESATGNERKRIRLCAHKNIEDKLHEMLIVHDRDAYVRPHKHLNKSESFHLIEGEVDVILFDETGGVIGVIQMGDYSSGRDFYYRLSDPCYHTLLIRSGVLVFHETTSGPFNRAETVFAPWSPEDSDVAGRAAFMKGLKQEVSNFVSRQKLH